MRQTQLHKKKYFRNRMHYYFVTMVTAAGFFCSATTLGAQNLAYIQRGGSTYSQITDNSSGKVSLRRVLSEIEELYDIKFAINDGLVENKYLDGNKIKYGTVRETLTEILTPLNLGYNYVNGYYVIRSLTTNPIDKPLLNPFSHIPRHLVLPLSAPSATKAAVAQIVVTGKVTTTEGVVLPGARVNVKGTANGTVTDINGNYKLTVDGDNAILVFVYIGFKTQEVPVTGRKVINIELEKDVKSLKSVVITVPYGKQTASSFTGSETTLDDKTFAGQPRASLQESLQGNVPGLQSMTASGQPGFFPNVRIRGIGSYSASSDPLYVVDGVPVVEGTVTALATSSNSIAGINPNDIESVTVLKDASATSIYGSRAANGVIMITTKSGAEGKTKINATVQRGFSDLTMTDRNRPLNTSEMTSLLTEGVLNNPTLKLDGHAITTQEDALKFLTGRGLDPNVNTDWYDVITQQAQYEQYNVSASGGNKSTRFYTSLGYYKQDAVTRGQGYDRMNARLNLKNDASRRLTLNVGIAVNYQKLNTVPNAGSGQNPIRSLNRLVPWIAPYDEDGNYNFNMAYNPEIVRKENVYDTRIYHLSGNAGATLKIIDPLSFQSKAGIDLNYSDEFVFWSPLWTDGKGVNGRGRQYTSRYTNWNVSNLLKFSQQFGDVGVEATLGQEASRIDIKRVSTQAQNYAAPGLLTLSNAAEPYIAWSSEVASSLVSYFLNTTFNYKRKYYLNATARRDGSSRFGRNVRYGNFWSLGAAWNLDKEDFMESLTFINTLKIRSSYGTSGNLVPGYYAAQGMYSTGYNYASSPGYLLSQIENGDLTWEQNKPFDIGVDFSLLDYRLEGTVDYYTRTTSNLLLSTPVSRTNGVTSLERNVGSFKNSGIEISLKSRNIKAKSDGGFEWTTAFNISTQQNEILKLDGEKIYDGRYLREVGGNFYEYWMRAYAGVNPENGEALWYTNSSRKATTNVYNDAQPFRQGSALSKFFGGLTNTFSYKNFSLSFLLYYNWGGQVYDIWGNYLQSDGSAGVSDYAAMARMYYDNHWQKPGDHAAYPKVVLGGTQSGLSNQASTRFLYDGSYIRLRDVTLSYNIPVQRLHWPLNSVKVYLRANNLLTYIKDDLMPFDPEGYIAGSVNQDIPISRQILAGIDISF